MQESPGLKPGELAAINWFSIKNGNIFSKISLSRIFPKIGRSEGGRYICLSPFLNIRIKGNVRKEIFQFFKHFSKIFHIGLQIDL